MKHLFHFISIRLTKHVIVSLSILSLLIPVISQSQIWEPEGINMPGGWNSWNNPPLNNLALASSTQVPGGRVLKFSTGIQRWQTIFSVAATGGDIAGGSYAWLFTSGPSGSPWNNKWASVNVVMNTLQNYTYNNGPDNQITVVDGKWYTANFEDAGYNANRAIFMETSAEPVNLTSLTTPVNVDPGQAAAVTLTLSGAPAPEEVFYLRFSTDFWATSAVIPFTMTGLTGSVLIPGQPADTTVSYYAFSSTLTGLTDLFDLYTIKLNNNGGNNYSYTVVNPAPVITFVNLQSPATGSILPGENFQVTGHVQIPGITGQPLPAAGIEAWVGWSALNTNPSTWTNWITAQYIAPSSFFDVFLSNLGPSMNAEGTWYYATRFRYNGGEYKFGGYSVSGGGYWDGVTNISGVLTVLPPSVPANLSLQNVSVEPEQSACYNATQTITVGGGTTFFKVLSGGSATFIAGQKITFLPGTGVASGGYMHAYITGNGQYCGTTSGKSAISETGTLETGVSDLAENIRIYPNPASDWFNVEVDPARITENSRVEIYNYQGQLIQSAEFSETGLCRISSGNFQPGAYLLKTITKNQVQTKKLIIR